MIKVTEKNFRRFENFALVTGAAGGMGRLYCEQLALMGYNIVAVDLSEGNLRLLEDSVKALVNSLTDWRGGYASDFRMLSIVQDLSLMEAAETIKSKTDEAGAVVEVLVNNAGMLYATGIAETSPVRLRNMMQVHCTTPLLLCREYVPEMKRRHNGYVLNISSLAAWMPWPCLGMYSSTKRFVKDYSRSLRIECRGTGVSVTNAYFGAVDTSLIPLPPNLRAIARGLAVMIRPQKAVDAAIKATFKRRKGTMPGVLNHIFRPICAILPENLLGWCYRKFGHYFANF